MSKNQIPQTEQSAQTNEHAKTDGADLAEKEEMPVALRLVMFGDLSPRREEYFKTDFHDAVLRDLNIDLTVEFLPWSSKDVLQTIDVYKRQIQLKSFSQFSVFSASAVEMLMPQSKSIFCLLYTSRCG